MKVGIVTFFRSVNHGAVLQAFALQNVIQQMGHECMILNYRTRISKNANSLLTLQSIRSPKSLGRFLIDGVFLKSANLKRLKRVDDFVDKNMVLSRIYDTYEDIKTTPPDCDVLVCGSDQIWNPHISGLDGVFHLDFAMPSQKRVAYAASFGVSRLPEECRQMFRRSLATFAHISVRETQGSDIVADLIDRNAKVVLDPTLLLSEKEWNQHAAPPICRDPYILCHAVGNPSEVIRKSRMLHKQTGCPIVRLDGSIRHSMRACLYPDIKAVLDAGPQEFLSLFCHAAYVVTASFHGTVFAILNRKPFVSVAGHAGQLDERSSRLSNMLDTFNLSSQLLTDTSSFPPDLQGIDYDSVDVQLQKARTRSLNYLRHAIENYNI